MKPKNNQLLRLQDIDKHFELREGLRKRRLQVLSGVSLSIASGEAVALVGESGSGKSTVAKIVARLLEPNAGKLWFDGRDMLAEEPRRASLDYRSQVQMIFQDPFGSLNPIHSIEHHLVRPLLRHGKASDRKQARQKAIRLLDEVGLAPGDSYASKRPHALSGGQLQRVAIARALAVEPRLLLADEPTSMLDVSIRAGVLNLMRDLKKQRDLSFLFITHDLASARYIADRILVMHRGKIVEEGPSDEVMDRPKHAYTQKLLAALPNPRATFRSR
jgi:peptide/nickel transport system ATP-binding protein